MKRPRLGLKIPYTMPEKNKTGNRTPHFYSITICPEFVRVVLFNGVT